MNPESGVADGLGTETLYMSAVELVRRIKARELSPVEVAKAALRQAQRLQPALNAFSVIMEKEALAGARAAEEAVGRGDALGPLHGVPFVIKDTFGVQGQNVTFGSRLFEDSVSQSDALVVERLKAAGAIPIGITNMPEFGHKATNDSPLHGITRNPWDSRRTPGGSSGGSAAAVCTGAGTFGIGTDGAGSVRIPAACCGVVGLKGTLGTIPNPTAVDAFGSLVVAGPLTRTVADAHLAARAMSGANAHDPFSYATSDFGELRKPRGRLDGVRILWAPKMGNELIDREVLELTSRSVRQLESMGANVEEVPLDLSISADLLFILNPTMHCGRFEKYLEADADKFDPSFRQSVEWGASISGAQLQRAFFERTNLFRRIQDLFAKYDFIVSPALSAPALSVEQQAWDPVEIGGHRGRSARYEWFIYAHPFNLSGNPAISIPSGWTEDGLPVGLQIAGRWHEEGEILAVAGELEAVQPWEHRYAQLDRHLSSVAR